MCSPIHLALMALTYGWIDGVSFQGIYIHFIFLSKYNDNNYLTVLKTYPSMVTGNLIQMGRALEKIAFHQTEKSPYVYWLEILFRNILVNFGCGFVGPIFAMHLKKIVKYRENTYAIIITIHYLLFAFTVLSIYFSRLAFEKDTTGVDDIVISQEVLTSQGHSLDTAAVTLLSISRYLQFLLYEKNLNCIIITVVCLFFGVLE